jgi:hypothetical protein
MSRGTFDDARWRTLASFEPSLPSRAMPTQSANVAPEEVCKHPCAELNVRREERAKAAETLGDDEGLDGYRRVIGHSIRRVFAILRTTSYD